MTKALVAGIKACLAQGGVSGYEQGLATVYGVSIEEVRAAIAEVGGTPCKDSPELIALRRVDEARRAPRTRARREYDHEE